LLAGKHYRTDASVAWEALSCNASAVNPEAFREALASVCTPVSVVTSHRDGHPHGTTVSAFCSLSLDPPMVLVSLDRSSDLLAIVTESRVFGINVLNDEQKDLALTFARKGSDKFESVLEGVEWVLDRGVPRIAGAATWLVCKLQQLHEGGDHLIAVGLVEHAESGPGNPLLYRRREFGTLAKTGEGEL
jgi:flavin reductase (DIM6/NTAB) family NADH-FMN oxidoreductase RutF